MFSADVVQTDKFISMSDQAQLLYYKCCCDAGSLGQVVARRVCVGDGHPLEALDELYENGYLIDVDGMTFIRHMWVNNSYNKRICKLWNVSAYRNGLLGFEGEYCRSPYVLLDGSVKPEPTVENGGKKAGDADDDEEDD